MKKWLYKRDFDSPELLYLIAAYWTELGYRVFIQGYSATDCREYGKY